MTGFHVDGRFPDHRKVRKLGSDRLAAVGLWTLCGAWCREHESDGFVPLEVLDRWDSGARIARRLVSVGLWVEESADGEPGFRYHEWREWRERQDAEEEAALEKRRAADRSRQKQYRARRNAEYDNLNLFDVQSDNDVTRVVTHDVTSPHGNGVTSHRDNVVTDGVTLQQGQEDIIAGQEENGENAEKVLDKGATLKHLSLSSCSLSVDKSLNNFRLFSNHEVAVETSSDETQVTSEEDYFTEFWNSYPRKQQRQDARKAWVQQRKKGVTPDRLIQGARGYAQYCKAKGTDRDYIKYPASWMRAGGYDDYQPEPEPVRDTRDPDEIIRDLWRKADAPAVAKIINNGAPYLEAAQLPSDKAKTPYEVFVRNSRRAWIEKNHAAAVQALKDAQSAAEASEGADGVTMPGTADKSLSVEARGPYGAMEEM